MSGPSSGIDTSKLGGEEITKLEGEIQTEINALQGAEGFSAAKMIAIQQKMQKLQQRTELASNITAAIGQAISTALRNLKGG